MTDKVQKIREEVERLKSQLLRGACSSQVAMETICKEEAYNEVLAILDTMQEDPKFKTGDRIKPIDSCLGSPRTIVDVCDSWYVTDQGTLDFAYEDNWEAVEEPVSEELKQAAKNYSAENVSYWYDDEECVETYNDAEKLEQTFKAGAKWQEAKDKSCSKDLGEYINELSKQFPEVSFAKDR